MREKVLTELVAFRLDTKTTQDLKRLSAKEKKNQSEVIRELIFRATNAPHILSKNKANDGQSN